MTTLGASRLLLPDAPLLMGAEAVLTSFLVILVDVRIMVSNGPANSHLLHFMYKYNDCFTVDLLQHHTVTAAPKNSFYVPQK